VGLGWVDGRARGTGKGLGDKEGIVGAEMGGAGEGGGSAAVG